MIVIYKYTIIVTISTVLIMLQCFNYKTMDKATGTQHMFQLKLFSYPSQHVKTILKTECVSLPRKFCKITLPKEYPFHTI